MGLTLAERLELRPLRAASHANIGIIYARTGRWIRLSRPANKRAVSFASSATAAVGRMCSSRSGTSRPIAGIGMRRGARTSRRSSDLRSLTATWARQRPGNLGNMCMFRGELDDALGTLQCLVVVAHLRQQAAEVRERIGLTERVADLLMDAQGSLVHIESPLQLTLLEAHIPPDSSGRSLLLGWRRSHDRSRGPSRRPPPLRRIPPSGSGPCRCCSGRLPGREDWRSAREFRAPCGDSAHQARSLYGKVGARTEGFKSVEILIKRLEARAQGHPAKGVRRLSLRKERIAQREGGSAGESGGEILSDVDISINLDIST